MIIIKKIALIIFGISYFSLICYAQEGGGSSSEWLGVHKKYIQSTSYIFEGKVIQQKIYYGKSQAIATSTIQITKIYKGSPQIKLGSIKVVTWQNEVYNGSISVPSEGRIVGINKGGTYIIFTRTANPSWSVDSTVTDNNLILTVWGMDEAIIISANDTVSWYGTPQFKTIEDVEAFFKANGLTVQEQVPQADSTKH